MSEAAGTISSQIFEKLKKQYPFGVSEVLPGAQFYHESRDPDELISDGYDSQKAKFSSLYLSADNSPHTNVLVSLRSPMIFFDHRSKPSNYPEEDWARYIGHLKATNYEGFDGVISETSSIKAGRAGLQVEVFSRAADKLSFSKFTGL